MVGVVVKKMTEGKARLTEIIDTDRRLDRTLGTSHAVIDRKH